MNKKFGKFRVGDLFEINKTISHDIIDLKNGKKYDYVTRSVLNRGVPKTTGFIDEESLNPKNTFSLELMNCTFFFREKAWYAGQFVRKISFKNKNYIPCWLYFEVVLNGLQKSLKSILIRNIDDVFKNSYIYLPLIDGTDDQIDFCFMEEKIRKLEVERIRELEAYLKAAGLDDYELTEEDKEVLKEKKEFGKFRIDEIFKVQTVKNKLSKIDLDENGKFPCYSSDTLNGGILGYTNSPEFIINEEHPCYVIFGDHTRTMNIAQKSFSVLDNVKVLIPITNNENILLYIFTKWKKQIPNQGYARHWSIAKNCVLDLPIIKNTNQIDFDYMEKYMKAMQKIAIADVVKYKDSVIEATKKVIEND